MTQNATKPTVKFSPETSNELPQGPGADYSGHFERSCQFPGMASKWSSATYAESAFLLGSRKSGVPAFI